MPTRWILAGAALLAGACVTLALLVYANPESGSRELYVAARDVPAGAALDAGAVRLVRARPPVSESLLFGKTAGPGLLRSSAAHDLVSGQLLQRGDVASTAAVSDRRLVWLPLKDGPAVAAGESVDLLLVLGSGSGLTVMPFALGVTVESAQGGGVVVAVPSSQASAYVYTGLSQRLVAVVAEKGARRGGEQPVASLDQALAAIR